MFNKKSNYIWLNHAFVPWDKATIHTITHALHYSSSVFEGIRSYGGKIFEGMKHAERLIESAKILEMKINYSAAQIETILYSIIDKNNIQNAYIRPLIWRGDEEMRIYSPKLSTNFLVMCWEMHNTIKPIELMISKWKKFHPDTFPSNCKAGAMYSMMTKIQVEALRYGYRDALLLDLNNNIAECTCSNIFFYKNKTLYTPKITNIINGITRQTIIKIAKSKNLTVIENDISVDQLNNFDGAFMTGTAIEIVPVSLIDTKKGKITFPNTELTNMFIDEYSQLVGHNV